MNHSIKDLEQGSSSKENEQIEIKLQPADDDERSTDDESYLNVIETKGGLKRSLKARHVQFISIAGAIGTGLFISTGSVLSKCGPAPLLMGYTILCIFVWSIMNLLSEMVTYIPLPGRSTPYAMCLRYTGNKSAAFTEGLNLAYAQAILTPAEISAAAFIVSYWLDWNPAIWISIFLVLIVAINMCSSGTFGEIEFWIAAIKIITLTGLIIVGVVIFFGGGPSQHGVLGFRYWKNPGSFKEFLVEGATGKFLAVLESTVKSGFAFVLSPELITCCAAEAEDPRINLPKATERFIYRLIFFYVCGALVIGIIVPYNSSRLMSAINEGAQGAAASPFVIGIQNAGIKVLNHIVNAAILTSAFSAGNSFMFGASRNLHSMAVNGAIPRVFARCNRFGVPYYSVAAVAVVACLAYLTVSNGSSTAFTWLSNISTVSGFLSWIFISITYIRYRKAIAYHHMESRITYRPPLQKIGAYFCVVIFTVITLVNGFPVFFDFNAADFIAAYITVPIILVLYFGHAIWTKNWRLFAPPEEIDCITGLKEIEAEQAAYIPKKPRNIFERIWFWIA
ncbi:hypothetical protein FOA43_000142 [Brettanomyces nanus]|uniref:Amino acid permease/ SLC12A domain-containing protein n=1 Tax=Eeniella nana TaxID=13502 RepID=A0A875RMX4_EENNA|nr:uncharacterized protein FOA43_000142 [Brettanomyces nanus]QPG72840.1 hypothetical protein FOA43_000142 [Brettanomyces nanus]